MSDGGGLKRACDFYVRNAGKIGALYCVVPTLAWFGFMMTRVPAFRDVYLLRLGISVVVGGLIAAGVNRFGLGLWIAKHRSPNGPAGLVDGALVGAGIGVAAGLLPPLTNLIATNHMADAKTFIIAVWLAAPMVGALIGIVLATIGRKHIERDWPSVDGGSQ
ncbi:MAG: hypothetical protein ACYTKD_20010 [Planctomycetota bacterium]|jgi:hypothetical protein